jgi:hypothetical protein
MASTSNSTTLEPVTEEEEDELMEEGEEAEIETDSQQECTLSIWHSSLAILTPRIQHRRD